MNNIKFKAYIKSLKWMVPVMRINFDVGTVEVDLTDGNGDLAEYDFHEVELMQFTGFHTLGKEIYDGDILQITIDDPVELTTDIGIVKMSNHSGSWIVEDKDGNFLDKLYEWVGEDVKVIGNIYKNPELFS